ncbi:integrator complex subunit 6-like isoform X1 [Canis lupus baileyi]|uniref:integrator complex subunit 6-like n=2 Tax=Canis lupus TaxID=9612 RepID=UPI00005A5FE9|nr:integrator complex subunit 6-like [Canis lupus familiaris]XP_038306879.1 integrator complex subunit 6-like [Canis lupus familiaris]XP_038306880.1 integrator complex subunit 6-like [Canis lupus familiaris]XP_038306881.1 integrator complex subunit 6-like [Canis lupus familiaris]XP_038306882.1 integrator complex subunit 6-like [Canis lupus familiaris]XP_038306883.1 integrator complex subunit 6-like [Canis lupus familiaris]XP_038306884.1 integrator complex subunit 6-like [Canis lupus familiari|eukprot:XP_013966975.1 integrator complex subunit 6-like isoform X1 [Canis lupus familiaris]
MKHPRKSITPPSSKKMQRMALLSVKEEGEGASHPGGSAISLEDDDFKVAAMSASDVPDKLPIPMVINMEIKEQLKKEIREFGGQHEKILKLLEGVQGPPELQRKFVVYAMKQAVREQRQALIGHLQKVLDKLELDHFLKKDIHTDNL